MTKLEKAFIDGVKAAQKDYSEITGGWWLSHGPESFINHSIAIKVWEQGFWVYPEASPKKIIDERDDRLKGRPPKGLGQRFDIVVWAKSSDKIRAILEIKRAWSIADLRSDRDKVATFLKRSKYVKAGYLLVYTEAKGEKKLLNQIANWANDLDCKLVGKYADKQGDGEWNWGIGLFRLP
jgi:hypothetical protein